jgi:cytolysin-activating lysine-acyltransferase
LSPETLRQLAEMRDRVQSTVGRLVLALGGVSRYSHQTFADVQTLIMEPLIRERIVIASQRSENGASGPQATSIVAIAFWASVSDAVDANIRAQIASGVCPVRLRPDDWTSGTTIWLLDLVAPSKAIASTMLANFAKTVQLPGQINLHPVVSAQVDAELLGRTPA